DTLRICARFRDAAEVSDVRKRRSPATRTSFCVCGTARAGRKSSRPAAGRGDEVHAERRTTGSTFVPRNGPQCRAHGADLRKGEPPWGVEPQTYALRELP